MTDRHFDYPDRRFDKRDGWTASRVGCHWTKGPYTISTISQGPRYGYAVYLQGVGCLASFVTWNDARSIADNDANKTGVSK